jgi:alpha-N-arabinofuranosidase
MLIALLKNADRVKIACLAQLVNVIAPIMTEAGGPAWRQTIFYPFRDASTWGRGRVLRCPVRCDCYDSKEYAGIPYLETVAVHHEEEGRLTIFGVNRNLTEAVDLEAGIFGFEGYKFIGHTALYNQDLKAVNSAGNERVKPAAQPSAAFDGGRLSLRLPPASWNVIRLEEPRN